MKSSYWLFVIILAITVYTIIVIISDIETLVDHLQSAKIEFILLGVFVVFIGLIPRSFRWYLMIKELGIKVDWKPVIPIYFSGLAFGLSPGRLGEVAKSIYLKRLVDAPIQKTAPTIIVERLLDVIAVLVISLSAFLLIGEKHVMIIISFFILLICLFLIYKKTYLIKILNKTQRIPFLGKFSNNLIASIDIIFVLLKPKLFIKMLILSVISWMIESLVVYFVLKAFDIDLSIIRSAFIYVTSSLVGAASFLPGGIGTTEGGFIGLLLLENIPYQEAIGPVIIIRSITLWLLIIFGIIIGKLTEIFILKKKI